MNEFSGLLFNFIFKFLSFLVISGTIFLIVVCALTFIAKVIEDNKK